MENVSSTGKQTTTPAEMINAEAFFAHWQSHRGLTRRVIEAFPEEALFQFSIGGMRPFSELAMEMIEMAGLGITGIVTGNWKSDETFNRQAAQVPTTKNELLQLWDKATETLNTWWPKIPSQKFQEVVKAFDLYEGIASSIILYFIDNEIHHRGQGYVYLRALGIEPPPFWDRY